MHDEEIYVGDVIDGIRNHHLTALNKTRAHSVNLLNKTNDYDGFKELNDFVNKLEEHLKEFFEKEME